MKEPLLHPVQRAALKRMGIAGRLKMTASLWDQARTLKMATLRALHPDWSEEEVEQVTREAFQRASER